MTITLTQAQQSALDFLVEEWQLSPTEREWLTVIDARSIPDGWWYIVELGVKDLPDKWIIQVFDDGECDPCYTFTSPFSQENISDHLENLPEKLALTLQEERKGYI
ncbi:MAG: hypothetical protein AB4041_21805 [Microcystaceae cyanobacterium]